MPQSMNEQSGRPSPNEGLEGVRLALIGPLPPPNGGMAMQTQCLAERFRQEGFQLELVPVNAPYSPQWVSRLKGLRALFRLVPYVLHLRRAAREAQVFHVMANSGWSWHLFAAPAIWIGSWSGVPVILNYRGGAAAAFLQRQFRWVIPSFRRASCVVVPSPYLQEVFNRFGVEAAVIPNCVDAVFFRQCPALPGKNSRGPILLIARHLEPIYDIGTGLRAFSRIRQVFPSAELLVAGNGPERDSLMGLAANLELGASVKFLGNIERAQMPAVFQEADLLLNPSLEDNMPNSLLESMASGVPIVTTDSGGIPFMVKQEWNGLLVERANAEAMAEAALRVLQDHDLRIRLVEAGLEYAGRYVWGNVSASWLALYRTLRREEPGCARSKVADAA